jgi:hypothetical protein
MASYSSAIANCPASFPSSNTPSVDSAEENSPLPFLTTPNNHSQVSVCLEIRIISSYIYTFVPCFYQVQTQRPLYLLAFCHYLNRNPSVSYSLLKGCTDLNAQYLFGKCCLDLNKLNEAEICFLKLLEVVQNESTVVPLSGHRTETRNNMLPSSTIPAIAAIQTLLGTIYKYVI